MTQLDKFIKVCKKYLYIKDTEYIDVTFGVIFANRLDSEPVWLYLVGPPSSGKTDMANALYESSEIVAVDKINKTSLVSGYGKKKEPSLLPKLANKILVIKDFTAMLNMRYNDLMEVLGLLRAAYDGRLEIAFGTGVVRCKGRFGVIACVTNAIDKHIGLLSDLGERFVTYRMPRISKFEEAKRCMKAMNNESLQEKEKEISEAALRVLEQQPNPASISEYDKLRILKVSQIAALARCSIHRDRRTQELEIPSPEAAIRLSEQLANLAVGIAMAREKKKVTKEEIGLVQRVAVYSMSEKRLSIMKSLLHYYPDYVTPDKLIEVMVFKFSEVVIRRWLDEMMLLNLVERKAVVTSSGKTQYRWQLKEGKLLKKVLYDN